MDRYLDFGIRSEADEQIRRCFRDAFARAGLSHEQFLDALAWYRDHGRQIGADPIKLAQNFHEYAAGRGWQPEQLAVAISTYDLIAEQGPAAALEPTSAESDADVIARADALLKSDPAAYWADETLQELALEARERQAAAPAPEPGIDHDEIERRVAQQEVDRFAGMLRQPAEAAKYWASGELQERHRRAIAASTREAPAAVPPVVAPVVAAVPSPSAAKPAAPGPVKVVVSDAARRGEIETMMRTDGGKAYWNNPDVQAEYNQVLARLAGEAPPLAPAAAAPEAVPTSTPAEAPPQDAG
jgi:hypothetical protein